jgi:hypothetical protein
MVSRRIDQGRNLELKEGEIMKAKITLLIVAAFVLSGCGDAANMQAPDATTVKARDDMMHAKTAYTACLQQHSADLSACAGFKEAYEVDLQAYRAISGGIRTPGVSITNGSIQTPGVSITSPISN